MDLTRGRLFLAVAFLSCAILAQTPLISERNLLSYLLDRLGEPVHLIKGSSRRIFFKVPSKYLRPRLRPFADEILGTNTLNTGDAEVVNIPEVNVPDLGPAGEFDRFERFSTFIPRHRRAAKHLIEIFLGMPKYEDFLSAMAFCRENVNPFLLAYASSVAILHRPDTRNVPVPNYACHFPQNYFPRPVFPRLKLESSLPEGRRAPVEIPRDWTATDREPEHRVAYFREDVGVNIAHWVWHLTFPFEGPVAIVNKDRRGELFHYFHQQIIARYNFERLSNNLGRVRKYSNFRDPIVQGYFPKLDTQIASRLWPGRQANSFLSDIERDDLGLSFDIEDLMRWRDRIYEAVHMRRVITDRGEFLPIDDDRGIDVLGNILESSILSINRNYYGDFHNLVHTAISFVHDPDNRHLESFAVMGDATVAMRDPIFYPWHTEVLQVFIEHKATLTRYTTQQLGFEGIQVVRAEVQTPGLGRPNEFRTIWQQRDLDLSRGLDFAPRGPVFVRVTHLQHFPFVYSIQVRNSGNGPRDGTVRIFLAPSLDENRRPLSFRDQRNLFIELDKFRVRMEPGLRNIVRWYNESSVAISAERIFRNVDAQPLNASAGASDYCGCGWPQYMLIPRGSPEGLQAKLFVMISDYALDQVQQTARPNACADGHSYCGIRDQLWPDRRSMGFPLDRPPRLGVQTLQDFLTPNMRAVDVLIVHEDRTVPPGATVG